MEPVYCSMSSSNYCFLTCVHISQEAGQVVWYSHLLKNFPQFIVIHTVKGFGIVNKAEVDVFPEPSCFYYDLIFWAPKITADGDCSHEIKRHFLLGRKVMTNLDSIFKSRDITLPTKSRLLFFQWSCMDVRVGLWRMLSAEELMLLNCGVGEDSWESLGQEGDPTSPS